MYDLKEIKAISCKDVAQKHGINLKKYGDRLLGKLRQEKTASFSINESKNFWYDFGSCKGGSCIDLVMELEGVTKEEAIRTLAEEYNISHIDQDSYMKGKWRPLLDNQYKELGIKPEMATMNFNFDLNKHSIDQLERWSEKFGMPVKNLAIKYPDVYNRMVEKIALENIKVLKDSYYAKIRMYQEPSTNNITKKFLKETCIQDVSDVNKKIDLLQRAIISNSIDYAFMKINFEKDLQAFQVKPNEIKQLTEDEKIRERIVNVYKRLFNYNLIEYFSVDQAKALKVLNAAISKEENKFVPIESIKKAYNLLGDKLQNLEKDYNQALRKDDKNLDKVKNDLDKVKDLFNKCNTVIEGIREANINYKNEVTKQNNIEKPLQRQEEMNL